MTLNQITRVTRSKEEAREFYNHISYFYDFSEGSFERKYINKGIEVLSVKEGDIVLEIGIGTGESVLNLAQLVGKYGKVYGVDISDKMIDITRKKLVEKDLLNRVELICTDAVNLSFISNFFDKIFMSFTLELFDTPEIPKVLSECFRVLKNKGTICVESLSKKHDNAMVHIYEWLHTIFSKSLDCRPIFVEEELRKNGFQIGFSSVFLMWGLPIEIVVGEVLK